MRWVRRPRRSSTSRTSSRPTERRGNKAVYTFDGDGNITEVVNALNEKTSFTFDANGNETSVTNALGETVTRTFESVTGKQMTERNHLGHITSISYPQVAQPWQRQNPLIRRPWTYVVNPIRGPEQPLFKKALILVPFGPVSITGACPP